MLFSVLPPGIAQVDKGQKEDKKTARSTESPYSEPFYKDEAFVYRLCINDSYESAYNLANRFTNERTVL